jgi:PhnB protein
VELDFDGHIIMFSDEYPEIGCVGPQSLGGTSVTIHFTLMTATR